MMKPFIVPVPEMTFKNTQGH